MRINKLQDYQKRLKISLKGDKHTIFHTKGGYVVSVGGYNRVVIGKRGPYIEFDKIDSIVRHIPKDQEWRLYSKVVYYIEYRTNEDNVKIYYQLKPVDYADYKVHKYYISPFDLYIQGERVIDELKQGVKNEFWNSDI